VSSEETTGVCVVHLDRNSLRYASKEYWGPITRQLLENLTGRITGWKQILKVLIVHYGDRITNSLYR
jgi:transposase-like protein